MFALSLWATAALAMLAVGKLFNLIESQIPSIPAEYKSNPAFRTWPGWTESYMIAHPIWFGSLFAAGFTLFNKQYRAAAWVTMACRGVCFGAIVFALGSMPIFVLIYASFQVPPDLVIVSWAFRNLTQYLVAGTCVGLMTKEYQRCLLR